MLPQIGQHLRYPPRDRRKQHLYLPGVAKGDKTIRIIIRTVVVQIDVVEMGDRKPQVFDRPRETLVQLIGRNSMPPSIDTRHNAGVRQFRGVQPDKHQDNHVSGTLSQAEEISLMALRVREYSLHAKIYPLIQMFPSCLPGELGSFFVGNPLPLPGHLLGDKTRVDERQLVGGNDIIIKSRLPGAIWPCKNNQ